MQKNCSQVSFKQTVRLAFRKVFFTICTVRLMKIIATVRLIETVQNIAHTKFSQMYTLNCILIWFFTKICPGLLNLGCFIILIAISMMFIHCKSFFGQILSMLLANSTLNRKSTKVSVNVGFLNVQGVSYYYTP